MADPIQVRQPACGRQRRERFIGELFQKLPRLVIRGGQLEISPKLSCPVFLGYIRVGEIAIQQSEAFARIDMRQPRLDFCQDGCRATLFRLVE